jgi:hypothetical protein
VTTKNIRTFVAQNFFRIYGKRQNSLRLLQLRTGIGKMDWEVSIMRTMEHIQGNQNQHR